MQKKKKMADMVQKKFKNWKKDGIDEAMEEGDCNKHEKKDEKDEADNGVQG